MSLFLNFKTRDAIFDEKLKKIIHDTTADSLVEKELTQDEQLFFDFLKQYAQEANLNGHFEIERNSFRDYIINFENDTNGCHVGRVNLYLEPPRYAVKKEGNKRASKIFLTQELALEFINTKETPYIIECRQGEDRRHFDYLIAHSDIDDVTVKNIGPQTVNYYIELIPKWISYIKKLDKLTQKRLKNIRR